MRTLIAALLLACLPACVTDPNTGQSVPDWPKIQVAVDEGLALVDAQAPMWAHRPDVQIKLEQLRTALLVIGKAVDKVAAGEPITTFDEAVQAAIALVDAWMSTVNPEEDPDLYGALSGLRGVLSGVRILAA